MSPTFALLLSLSQPNSSEFKGEGAESIEPVPSMSNFLGLLAFGWTILERILFGVSFGGSFNPNVPRNQPGFSETLKVERLASVVECGRSHSSPTESEQTDPSMSFMYALPDDCFNPPSNVSGGA